VQVIYFVHKTYSILSEKQMVRNLISIVLFSASVHHVSGAPIQLQMEAPKTVVSNISCNLTFQVIDSTRNRLSLDTVFTINGLYQLLDEKIIELDSIQMEEGLSVITNIIFVESGENEIYIPELRQIISIHVKPGWLSLIPPLIAILFALITRQVLLALFAGILIGAVIIYDYNPLTGFLFSFTDYIAKAPADPDKMSIIVFTLTLGGMVGVISKMGGTQGIVEKLSYYASDSRRGQLATWLMGVIIFFDDYANTLIVGNTMRPLTDKLKISREKLSYLVDSTAAPIANIAIISTWIGFEIGLINNSFQNLGISENSYITFFKTIPYNFYPIFTLAVGFFIAWMHRDFGPMLRAERRSVKTGQVLAANASPISSLDAKEMIASNDIPKRWYNGLIPIVMVIITTLAGLWFTGYTSLTSAGINTTHMGFIQFISTVIGESDSYAVLMWAAFVGSFIAIGMALFQKLLSLDESILAWVGGVKAMILAALILILAWSIGNICTDLKTADYVILISERYLSAHFIPVISFVMAALISFATGTSWGVMAILMPIVIPMAHLLPQADISISIAQQQAIFLSTIASVLAGATFGDHCSPISDTTIMSSMASGADHIDHVRTQLPYALLGGLISILIGYLPVGFGISTKVIIPIGIISIFLIIRFAGKKH
jgi:Na+/H+ antiporter NhaC